MKMNGKSWEEKNEEKSTSGDNLEENRVKIYDDVWLGDEVEEEERA